MSRSEEVKLAHMLQQFLLLVILPKCRTALATCKCLIFHSGFANKCTVPSSSPAWHCLIAGEETLMAAAQHIGSILRQFNQQNLALALWAFAKLGWRPPTGVLANACRHALLTVDTINPQNLSNLLWALATMEYIPPAMLLEVYLPLDLTCTNKFVGHQYHPPRFACCHGAVCMHVSSKRRLTTACNEDL